MKDRKMRIIWKTRFYVLAMIEWLEKSFSDYWKIWIITIHKLLWKNIYTVIEKTIHYFAVFFSELSGNSQFAFLFALFYQIFSQLDQLIIFCIFEEVLKWIHKELLWREFANQNASKNMVEVLLSASWWKFFSNMEFENLISVLSRISSKLM